MKQTPDDADGANCWFAVGSALTRSHLPFLLHCFGGELFVFQLTKAQAVAMEVEPSDMASNSGLTPDSIGPATAPAISLERFEAKDTAITQAMPILGQLHYEVLTCNDIPYCVRLDYRLTGDRHIRWDHPLRPLGGKGVIDVKFPPIGPGPAFATKYRGPLVLFTRLFEMSPDQTDARKPISTTCATLVDVV